MLASHPSCAHVGVRIAALPIGLTTGELYSNCIFSLVSSNALEVRFEDVPVESTMFPKLDIASSAIRYDLGIEAPAVLPDASDAEIFYPNRSIIRAFLGIVDGAAHADLDQLQQAVSDFIVDVSRMHRQYGPPTGGDPIYRILVFNASDKQMDLAPLLGSWVRFLPLSDCIPALRVLMADVTGAVFQSLTTEMAMTAKADDNGTLSPAPDALGISATLPFPFMGHYFGAIDLALLFGVSGFSIIGGGGVKKRLHGRLLKHRAAVALMAGSPGDALDILDRSIKSLKSSNDFLFLGLAYELQATAMIHNTALCTGVAPANVAYLPDAGSVLRDSVACFDALASTPELVSIADVFTQLCISARLRLVRYMLCRAPQRALLALSDALESPEEDAQPGWNRYLHAAQLEPHSQAGSSVANTAGTSFLLHTRHANEWLAIQAEKSSAKALLQASTSLSVTGSESSSAVGNILRSMSAISPAASDSRSTASPAGSASAATQFDVVEALTLASGRCRDVRNPQSVIRFLLQCADLLELAGLSRKSDACIFRACRTLRSLQPVVNVEHLTVPQLRPAEKERDSVTLAHCGCTYSALHVSEQSYVYGCRAARSIGCKMVPWPLPWFENSDICPSSAPYRVTPGLAAALLSLCVGCRDNVTAAVLAQDLQLLNRKLPGTSGAPAARIVNPSTNLLDWLPTVMSDLWQCGELPLAVATASLCAASDTNNSALIALPAATSALRSIEAGELRVENASSLPPLISAARAAGVYTADSYAFSRLRNRRTMCTLASFSMACGNPLPLLRGFLYRTTISHALSPIDALCALNLLKTSVLEHQGALRHLHAKVDGGIGSGAECSDSHKKYGMVDLLIADNCCAPTQTWDVPFVIDDPGNEPAVLLHGGADKTSLSLQYGDTSMTSILWTTGPLLQQLTAYAALSACGLHPSPSGQFTMIQMASMQQRSAGQLRRFCNPLYSTPAPIWKQLALATNDGLMLVTYCPFIDATSAAVATIPCAAKEARRLIASQDLVFNAVIPADAPTKRRYFADDGSSASGDVNTLRAAHGARTALPAASGRLIQVHGMLYNASNFPLRGEVVFVVELQSGGRDFSNPTKFELPPLVSASIFCSLPGLNEGTALRLTGCIYSMGASLWRQNFTTLAKDGSECIPWDIAILAGELPHGPSSPCDMQRREVGLTAEPTLHPIPIPVFGTSWALSGRVKASC